MGWAARLAQDHDAICKVAGGRVLFLGRDEAALPTVTLTLTDFLECSVETDDRAEHGKTTAHWHDRGKARRAPEHVQRGEGPGFTLRHLFPARADARVAAEGKQRSLDRRKKSLRGSISGNTAVMAGAPLLVAGIGDLYDGRYTITSVEHSYSKSDGYKTQIQADAEPAKGSG